MELKNAFSQLKAARDEYEAARFALSEVLHLYLTDSDSLFARASAGVNLEDLRRCAEHLELTYTVRLFSVFEWTLLDYWHNGRGRRTSPAVRILIDRVAAYQGMSQEHRDAADAVREHRNLIVHTGRHDARLTFDDCKSHLGRFLAWLPPRW